MTRGHEVVDRRWVPRAAGGGAAFIGLIDVLSALSHGLHPRLRRLGHFLPGTVTNTAAAATLVIGVLLLLLAHGLYRRKRRAWQAVVILLGVSVISHVVKGFELAEALVAIALLAVLISYRDQFYALGDPRTRWRALTTFLTLAVADVVFGMLLLQVQGRHIRGHPSVRQRLQQVFDGLVGVSGPVQFRGERISDLVYALLFALGAVTALTTAYLILRPAEPTPHLRPDDDRRMRALLDRYGELDSLGYFALRRDKSVVWSRTGKSCIAYRVVSGVMLASGDPLGDPEAWPGAIEEFLLEAARHAWTPAVLGCSERGGQVWIRETGMDALEIGDEAIVETGEFSLEGRAMRNVRQMVNRVERLGYACTVRRVHEIPPEERAAVVRAAGAWRSGHTERGFSMALGRFGEAADGNCVLVTAIKDGRIRAFLHFVPWGEDGLSLDLMRRDRAADPGLNDLLIVAALRAAPQLGVRRMSLNFAVFRSALERGEKLGAGPVIRLWRRLLLFASKWFQIESLYRFNAKFQPTWNPRYVVFRRTGDLPRIAAAGLEAEAFLVMPKLSRLLGRSHEEPASAFEQTHA